MTASQDSKPNPPTPQKPPKSNGALALICLGVVGAMVGLAYASVPLYTIFCQVTGYGGTPQIRTEQADQVLDRTVAVRFDANVSRDMAWDFKPDVRQVTVKIGENKLAYFKAHNDSRKTVTGTATFNVTPEWAAQYFVKLDCFCFTEQTLTPGETAEMPVTFYVDPQIVKDPDISQLSTLTLSYTFFPAAKQVTREPAPAAREGVQKTSG